MPSYLPSHQGQKNRGNKHLVAYSCPPTSPHLVHCTAASYATAVTQEKKIYIFGYLNKIYIPDISYRKHFYQSNWTSSNCGSGQPRLAHSREVETISLLCPFQPRPFHDCMIILSLISPSCIYLCSL